MLSNDHFPRRFSPFQAARDEYLLAIEMEGLSPATLAKYRNAIGRLARFAGEVDPSAIDASLLRRFTKELADGGLATSSQATYLVAIKRWLGWLAEEGGYGVDSARIARAKTPRIVQEPIVPLTVAEIGRLFAATQGPTFRAQRLRTIVAILLDTGVRQSELLGLRLGDFNMQDGEIVVRPATDKTRKGRTIALGKRGKLELVRWWTRHRLRETYARDDGAALFIQHNGEGITRNGIQLMLKRLGHRAGVPGLHPHKFRHTFAILALRDGMNPFVLMHVLGHKDMAMTRRYLRIVDSDVREQKRAASPLDKLKL